ncbi:hypothetical protein Angca_000467, partial [Angiostrongylus cantonensis]
SVRLNCPCHPNSFRLCFFPFKLKEKLTKRTIKAGVKTTGVRLVLTRYMLGRTIVLGQATKPLKSTKNSFLL